MKKFLSLISIISLFVASIVAPMRIPPTLTQEQTKQKLIRLIQTQFIGVNRTVRCQYLRHSGPSGSDAALILSYRIDQI